jgi:hypothetical protein
MARIPLSPKNPERVCWGCDLYCPAEELRCGNGTIRAPHPIELFGENWLESAVDRDEQRADEAFSASPDRPSTPHRSR